MSPNACFGKKPARKQIALCLDCLEQTIAKGWDQLKNSQTDKPMTVGAAAALGVGSMVGAGIFALMGEAGTIAGSAVYLSFIAAGIIALASGYSMARLGARFPAAGGIVEYLAQGYGIGLISGALSILLYISALVALALVAKTFGSYALALLHANRHWPLTPLSTETARWENPCLTGGRLSRGAEAAFHESAWNKVARNLHPTVARCTLNTAPAQVRCSPRKRSFCV